MNYEEEKSQDNPSQNQKVLDTEKKVAETKQYNPRNLINKKIVQEAITKDLGETATLKSFEIEDFTKPGDNYACLVTSVKCRTDLDGHLLSQPYVVKLNARYLKSHTGMVSNIFQREGEFLTNVAPLLTEILEAARQPPLRMPECLYVSYEKDEEVIITRDLRKKGFTMIDRTRGMDVRHTTLVLEELARLHSAGYIHKKQLEKSGSTLAEVYPYMKNKSWDRSEDLDKHLQSVFAKSVDKNIKLIENVEGYEKAVQWLKNHRTKTFDMWKEMLKDSAEAFKTICHGDPWTNNFVCRYDEGGNPLEVTLLDLQGCIIASLATDLNYFLVSSTEGDVRKENLNGFLQTYYEMFEDVVRKNGEYVMPFTLDELKNEYIEYAVFGAMSGMFIVPIVLREVDEVVSVMNLFEKDKADEALRRGMEVAVKQMENPAFKARFLAIFDDLERFGLL